MSKKVLEKELYNQMANQNFKEFTKVRLHYIYCVYGDFDGGIEEIREFFSVDVGENVNTYDTKIIPKDGEEYVKFFNDDSPFSLWNKAFKKDGSEYGYYNNDACYFGINYYDALIPVEELKSIEERLEKRRNELCSM